ncbi:C-GCAxxG-C-C family protein [Mangrovibacterium lignilyticum]|uniref:C-GCAxxG-C-C family protein n=1 Tax=Mangrovibacterium lignilyticum TaxID=2668052 RepID=UPI0013D3EE28|nr:C-GCAxxG-C-C family protein [Mangrovibacterium lignilyticum]
MNKTERALTCFNHFNCCQAVLSAFNEELGLDDSMSLKLGAGFGGGMNCGETCGAVTGAYLVLGMALGEPTSDAEAKARTRQHILHFNDQFCKEQGSLLCKELLGVNISLDEGRQFATENNLFEIRCPNFVSTSVGILEEQLAGKKKGV